MAILRPQTPTLLSSSIHCSITHSNIYWLLCATIHNMYMSIMYVWYCSEGPISAKVHIIICLSHSTNSFCQAIMFQAQRIKQFLLSRSLQSSAFSQNISYHDALWHTGNLWQNWIEMVHNFHSPCTNTLKSPSAELNLLHITRVRLFWMAQLLWHRKEPDDLPRQHGDGWQATRAYNGTKLSKEDSTLVLTEGLKAAGSLGAHYTDWGLLTQAISHSSPQLSSLSSFPNLRWGTLWTLN